MIDPRLIAGIINLRGKSGGQAIGGEYINRIDRRNRPQGKLYQSVIVKTRSENIDIRDAILRWSSPAISNDVVGPILPQGKEPGQDCRGAIAKEPMTLDCLNRAI